MIVKSRSLRFGAPSIVLTRGPDVEHDNALWWPWRTAARVVGAGAPPRAASV